MDGQGEDGLRQATDSVETLIGGLGGEVERTTLWGKRRLAYEVKHLRDGHYVISHLKLDGDKVKDTMRAFADLKTALVQLYEHWEEAVELN